MRLEAVGWEPVNELLEPDRLPALISDKAMVGLLLDRIREVQLRQSEEAYPLALIGTGNFVEGLLTLMCWTPIAAIVNDIKASLGRARQGTH